MKQLGIFSAAFACAGLMGVEYIVTEKLFAGLPVEEQHLWHSHVHEVRSGSLIAPGIPELAERDKRFDVSSAELRQKRSDIPYPQIDAQADAWTKGVTMQLQMTKQ